MNEINKLIEKYRELAIKNGELGSDYKKANKVHKEIVALSKKIFSLSSSAQDQLLKLSNDDNPFVRLWVASDFRKTKPDFSKSLLSKIKSEDKTFASLEARILLDKYFKE